MSLSVPSQVSTVMLEARINASSVLLTRTVKVLVKLSLVRQVKCLPMDPPRLLTVLMLESLATPVLVLMSATTLPMTVPTRRSVPKMDQPITVLLMINTESAP